MNNNNSKGFVMTICKPITGVMVFGILTLNSFSLNALEPVVEESFIAPSTRYLSTHDLNYIKPFMKGYGVIEKHVFVFNNAIAKETIGFFGYCGAGREFRIYQDLIRFVVEDILKIYLRDDFQFLNIPGQPVLNINSAAEFLALEPSTLQDAQLKAANPFISLNLALYENYYYESLCSIPFFTKNHEQKGLETKLEPFFIALGINKDNIRKIFTIARSKLPNEGILLQFFDDSNYELLNKQAYCSLSNGTPYLRDFKISDFLLNPNQNAFPRIRLIMNNRYTLNPHSSLKVIRYDMTAEYVRQAYEQAIRDFLKTLSVDVELVKKYREELLSKWEDPSTDLPNN